MRKLFGGSREPQHRLPQTPAVDLGPYEGMEGRRGDIAGPWKFDRWDMSWHRPEYYYFRSVPTGIVNRHITIDRNVIRLRPGPLANIDQRLDGPFAVFRSHPETPDALPAHQEGLWADTNPAWPEMSVNAHLGRMGLVAVWEETSPDSREEYELVPDFVGGVVPDEALPFDPKPLPLSAVLIYARPSADRLSL